MTGRLTGAGLLLRAHLRSGWRSLIAWIALLTGLVVATAWSIAGLYPTPADRAAYAATAGASPAVAALNGRGYDLTRLGGITSYEVGFIALVGFPIVAIHLAIRFSRHEEDAGRTELVTAGRIGRLAPLAAASLTLAVAFAGFAVTCALGLQLAGLPARGAWVYAAALSLFAATFGVIGLLAAEVSRESRTAYGLGLGVVLVTFLGRAVVDGRRGDPRWAGPSGWFAEVRPWGESRWWPLVAYGVLALLAGALAVAAASRRDLGGGLVATRPGPAYGGSLLGTPAAMAGRFLRPVLVGWLVGTAIWSTALGGLAREMTETVRANPTILEVFPVKRPEDLVTSMAVLLCGIGAAAFGVQAMGRLAREEAAGRLGLLLSTRTGRLRMWLSWVAVAVGGSALVLLASTLALGVSAAWSTGDRDNVQVALGAGVALLIPLALIIATAALLHGMLPRLTGLAWAVVGWATIVGMVAEPLRLPAWARDLSPLYAVGQVPIEDPNGVALVAMALLTAGCMALGLTRFRSRELTAG